MIRLIEPLKKVILDGIAHSGTEVQGELFGGFCSCGGIMFQKLWIENETRKILISECEKCWKNEAMIFNSTNFEGKQDVEVLGRNEFRDFLKEILDESELEAVINRARNREYHPMKCSAAKKKISRIKLKIEEVLELLR